MRLLPYTCLVVALTVFTGFAGEDPVMVIKRINDELMITISQPTDGKTGDVEKLRKVTSGMFDFAVLSRSVLPKIVWDSSSTTLKEEFISAFRELVEYSSAGNLVAFEQDSTVYDTAVIHGDRASVSTHLWSKGRDNHLVYKMILADGSWKVVDLVINDLSTARNYKEQFNELLKEKSMREVIILLKNKLQAIGRKNVGVSP